MILTTLCNQKQYSREYYPLKTREFMPYFLGVLVNVISYIRLYDIALGRNNPHINSGFRGCKDLYTFTIRYWRLKLSQYHEDTPKEFG